ncbi:MAG: hypothetical protein AB2606_07985 [Candidatus Thiodiazotropha taylori]
MKSWSVAALAVEAAPASMFKSLCNSQVEQEEVSAFLRECLTSSNKFVRAWSYNGFYELAIQHPQYQQETKVFFEMAMRDKAPSVKARIRNIMKRGF